MFIVEDDEHVRDYVFHFIGWEYEAESFVSGLIVFYFRLAIFIAAQERKPPKARP